MFFVNADFILQGPGRAGTISGMAAASLARHAQGHGQQVDLTTRIREITKDYPEGTAILKEL